MVLTISFQPYDTSPNPDPVIVSFRSPNGWTSAPGGIKRVPSVALTSHASVGPGQAVTLTGTVAGTSWEDQIGTFTVVVAIGTTTTSFVVDTPRSFPPGF